MSSVKHDGQDPDVVRPQPGCTTDPDTLAKEAAAATEVEHNTGLLRSLKLYRKACLWSVFISTCIIMEGFDDYLLNNLYAYVYITPVSQTGEGWDTTY